MDLRTRLMELAAHTVVHKVPRQAGSLALVALLLDHPQDVENLQDNDAPEDAPDGENTFEGVDL